MKKVARVAAALLPLLASSSVFAQSVTEVKGSVLVNRGSGFMLIGPGASVESGDRIMARPGSRATIQYSPGCRVNVLPGEVVTVTEAPVCSVPDPTAGTMAGPEHSLFGFDSQYVGLGAAAIIAGSIIFFSGDSDSPTSP